MLSIKCHQLTSCKPNNIFSKLNNLHAVLQLANKQISFAMPFSSLCIYCDCSYDHMEKKKPIQDIFKVSWPYSDSPQSLMEQCANMLVGFLIDD